MSTVETQNLVGTTPAAPAAMVGSGYIVAQGTNLAVQGVRANTDGFAVVQVVAPSRGDKSSFAYGSIYTSQNWFEVLGGTVGSFAKNWNKTMNVNPSSMCIPVRAGTTWYYHAQNSSNNQIDSLIQFWWFPLGANVSGAEETFRLLTEQESAEFTPPPPPSRDAADDQL
ncbi:MAG TPA: hypothetical protein VF613_23260 [Longimicrobium sp.]|jgi:hypothetical protein